MNQESLTRIVGVEGYDALKQMHCERGILDHDIRAEQLIYQAAHSDTDGWEISGFIYTLMEIISHELGHYLIQDMKVLEVSFLSLSIPFLYFPILFIPD